MQPKIESKTSELWKLAQKRSQEERSTWFGIAVSGISIDGIGYQVAVEKYGLQAG